MEEQQTHRPGAFKQLNKLHKYGKHSSKREISREAKGKVSVKVITKQRIRNYTKAERKNHARQLRQNQKEELLLKRRGLKSIDSGPLLVAVVPLTCVIDIKGIENLLKQPQNGLNIQENDLRNIHIISRNLKERFTFFTPNRNNIFEVLDAVKVADVVLFLVSAVCEEVVDRQGEIILFSICSQGLPTAVTAITDLESINPKKQQNVKQRMQNFLKPWFPDEKLLCFEKTSDVSLLLRKISNQKQHRIIFCDNRPHLLTEGMELVSDNLEEGLGTLKVCGYLRGKPLSVNNLVHIEGLGDFQMSHIYHLNDPYVLELNGNKHDQLVMKERLLLADKTQQESLQQENIPDPMDAEQTWPTEEEMNESFSQIAKRKIKKIPKGMSEYQAAWIPDDDAIEMIDESDEDDYMSVASSYATASEHEEYDSVTSLSNGDFNPNPYDDKIDFDNEKQVLEEIKEARIDKMFPDEIDTPLNMPARVRFQKYRGLESFRTSYWDPKENLPHDYARIFQFENYERTRKSALKYCEETDGVMPGSYIKIHVANVPLSLAKRIDFTNPLIIFGLLRHEQKISILNLLLKRSSNSVMNQLPIKSKERLLFQCGYRRFYSNPIFSQHTNGNKHKFERFFQPDSMIVATLFAPIMFTPAPVLVYKERSNGILDFIASGRVLSINPDRIVTKRIVLSGHPFKLLKNYAVVRFMFFNREDIDWFKPVELVTKDGRRGHIKEALGIHGHMKCIFDHQLKSQDTVLMKLYKRVFPKLTYELFYDKRKLNKVE